MCSIGLTSILRAVSPSFSLSFSPFFCLRPPFPPRPWRRLDFPRFSMTSRHPLLLLTLPRCFKNEASIEVRIERRKITRVGLNFLWVRSSSLSSPPILPLLPNCLLALRNRSSIRSGIALRFAMINYYCRFLKRFSDILELLNCFKTV